MRRSLFLLGPLVAGVILFACEDTPSTDVTIANPDATSFEGGPQSEVGPPGDASIDAATDADGAASKAVSVNVLRGGAPAAGVTVVFHDAAGAVLETKSTAANGKAASSDGMKPAMASALLGAGNLRRVLTWTAVELGDELFANDIGLPASSGTVAVTLQGTFADGGAASALASVGTCTGNAAGTDVLVDLRPDCLRPTSSILARAINGGFDTVLAYAFKKANAAPVDAGTATATVGPWLTPGKTAITVSNIPLNTTPFATFAEIEGTLAYPNDFGGGLDRFNKANYDVAPGFADAYQGSIRFSPPLTPNASLLIGKRTAPAAMAIDLAGVLPTLDSSALDVTDVKRPKIDWTTLANASLATTDGGAVTLRFGGGGRTENKGWFFVVAPNAKTVKAPAMPPAAADWIPSPGVDGGAPSSFADPEITFVETDLLPGYGELRRDIGRIIPVTADQGVAAAAVLPANGTLKATSFRNQVTE